MYFSFQIGNDVVISALNSEQFPAGPNLDDFDEHFTTL